MHIPCVYNMHNTILHKYDNVFYINHITPLYMYSSHKLAGRVCSSRGSVVLTTLMQYNYVYMTMHSI